MYSSAKEPLSRVLKLKTLWFGFHLVQTRIKPGLVRNSPGDSGLEYGLLYLEICAVDVSDAIGYCFLSPVLSLWGFWHWGFSPSPHFDYPIPGVGSKYKLDQSSGISDYHNPGYLLSHSHPMGPMTYSRPFGAADRIHTAMSSCIPLCPCLSISDLSSIQ